MCCTMSAANLSETIIYCGLAKDGDHLLAYQNKAENLNPNTKSNAMIIPIPSSEKLGQDNIIDMSNNKKIFKNMAKILKPRSDSRSYSLGFSKGMNDSFEIFKSGDYLVISATDSLAILDALKTLPSPPPYSLDVANAYYEWYPSSKWKMIMAIWEGNDPVEASPFMIKYTPSNKEHLFMPGLDAHNGKRPNLRYSVQRDHTFLIGHEKLQHELPYNDRNHGLSWLPEKFSGFSQKGGDTNCDWLVSIKDLNNSTIKIMKSIPAYFEV